LSSRPLDDAFTTLRLTPEASRLDVERAYRTLKETYAQGGLATYSLLDAGQRRERLAAIEEAYRCLLDHFGLPRHHVVVPSVEIPADTPPLSDEGEPGDMLRRWREQRGLSLSEVGVRTKISPMTLENIENQQFEHLPAAVYLRGFLLQYLALLGVPRGEALAERYLARYAERRT